MTTAIANPPQVPVKKNENNPATNSSENDSLDLVRSILFGEQAQKAEERRMELERLLDTSLNTMQAEMDKRFDDMNQELSALMSLLADETKARQNENDHVKSKFSHITHKISQLEAKTQKTQSQLHEKMINETSKTNQAIRRVNEEISLKLEQAIKQLQYDKADRKALAGLLSGVAKELLESDKRS